MAAGFSSVVQPNGSKLWRLRYFYLGKERSLSIGAYPAVSLADARARRDEAKQQIAAGTDPSVQKKLNRIAAETAARTTFGLIAAEYLERLETNGAAPSTLKKNRWLLGGLGPPDRDPPDRGDHPCRSARPLEAGREERTSRDRAPDARRHRLCFPIRDRHVAGDERPHATPCKARCCDRTRNRARR